MSPPQNPRSVCGRARTRTWVLLAPRCPVAASNDLPPSRGLALASAPSLGPPCQQAKELRNSGQGLGPGLQSQTSWIHVLPGT